MLVRNINWPEERPAILEHIRLVHGANDSELLSKWYGTMPGFDPADCFVIDGEQGEIASHVMLIPRMIQFGDSVLQAAEIGVVGTLETYQKRGYATTLMESAIQRMSQRGDALSILFGIPNFYEQWEYEYAVGLYLTSYESSIATELALKAGVWDFTQSHMRRMAGQLGIRNREITVRPFDYNDLPAVMDLYFQSSIAGHSIMARDEQSWLWQIHYMTEIGRHGHDNFLVAEHDNSILAYMRMVTNEPVNWFRADANPFSIIEFAGTDPDATGALLAEAAVFARDYGMEQVGLYVHPQSTLMTHALAHGASQRNFTGAGFLRLNNLSLVLEGMVGTFQRRLDASPFAGQAIQLQVSNEQATASINLGHSASPEPIEISAPTSDLIRLFSGWFGLANLPSGSYTPKYEDVLKALFPKGDPKVSIADLI